MDVRQPVTELEVFAKQEVVVINRFPSHR
jgi:hypothetical protein